MKTKNCPFCSKEISDEAIICKFCHRLLIDENGNDILPDEDDLPEDEVTEDTAAEDKTIIYNKEDIRHAMEESKHKDDDEDEYEEDEEFEEEDLNTEAVIRNDTEADDDDGYEDDGDDLDEYPDDGEEDDYEEDEEPAPPPRKRRRQEEEYDDSELADDADYDPKRTFMVTAIVTIGILLIVIVAILVGYKLFGSDDTDMGNSTTPPAPVTQSQNDSNAAQQPVAGGEAVGADTAAGTAGETAQLPASDSAADAGVQTPTPTQTPTDGSVTADPNQVPVTQPTDDSAYVPSVVNDTVSENPEEIVNSSLSDPVNTDSTTTVTDPATTVPGTESTTDSGSNITIIRDDSSYPDDSTSESSADSVGDGPTDSSSSSASTVSLPDGSAEPAFQPAGDYYSWGEAGTLMDNYANANGISGYEYWGGTDAVEMLYAIYDDNGNATIYRVDLQTGVVSPY